MVRRGTEGMVYNGSFAAPTDIPAFISWALSVGDERVKGWPLMDSPLACWTSVVVYLIAIPIFMRYMRNREAMSINWMLVVYNAVMVLTSAWMCVTSLLHMYRRRFSLMCNAVEYGPDTVDALNVCYVYFLSKGLEFFDTFAMIAKRNFRQVTFLHVYHHAFMFFIWWFGVKYVGGGDSLMSLSLNAFVHTIMYFYYLLTGMGMKEISWKKHLTTLQIGQFVLVLVHCVLALVANCDYPTWMYATLLLYMLSLIALFSNFYLAAYSKKPKARSE